MAKRPSVASAMSLYCGIICAFCALTAYSEDALGPMAGTGGVMRDAERRALSAAAPRDDGAKPAEIAPPASPVDSRMAALKARALGKIARVEAVGTVEFAQREFEDPADSSRKITLLGRLNEELADGEEKTMGDVTEAIIKVRKEFVAMGFYLARIMLAGADAYDASSQVLTVRIEEGRFGSHEIRFADGAEEGRWFSRAQLEKRFAKLREGDSFDYGVLRSALFEANSHPDLIIDTSIDIRRPMPVEGEGRDRRMIRYADMGFDVRESIPLHMVWEVNNYGMEEVEEWQTSLTAQYLNLTKHDDVLTISPAMSFGHELKSIAASYMLPHQWWRSGNTTLYGGYSKLDVDDIVPRLDLEGTGYFVGLQHSENLVDTDRHLWALSAGALWRYIEDQYTAMGYSLDERGTTIVPLSLALSYTGRKPDGLGGRNFGAVQMVYNVANMGDKVDEMWTDADEHYWLVRWQLARLQPLFGVYNVDTESYLHQWVLFMKLEGQYTSDNLLPVEKLSLGGYNCLRGYHARGYLGDWGVYGTVELRTPILVDSISSLFSDRTNKKPVDRLQFLAFLDYGYVAYNDLPGGYDDSESLASCGIGVRFALTKYSQLRCDFAIPMVNGNNDEDDDYEIYFSYQLQF